MGRITEDTPEHQGVVVFNMSDVPLVSLSEGDLYCLSRERDRERCSGPLPQDKRCGLATDPQGFGATARSTLDTRKLDPSGIVVFHQADVGEFLRDEDTMF